MRFATPSALAVLAGAVLAAPAGAAVPHTVSPGDTLWGIAAANGFTTRSLAAYNGLSETSNVVLGATVKIPTVSEASAAMQAAGLVPGVTSTAATPSSTSSTSAAPAPMGGYTVRPGDTLSGLAARSGVSVAQMAYMNGLAPTAHIIAGTALKLPTGSPVASTSASSTSSTPVRPAAPAAAPQPTPARLSSGTIGSIAAQNGVSPSLASAVAWQESGFNNGAVSSTGARGVMQVMPGTWSWVEQNLSGPLDPASAADNVRAGALYLGRLLRQTGGDTRTAVAGYYQGLGSVQYDGMFPETKRYVDNVLALQGRFGG
jgi:soluble lytic murein transglycosylase-like protein